MAILNSTVVNGNLSVTGKVNGIKIYEHVLDFENQTGNIMASLAVFTLSPTPFNSSTARAIFTGNTNSLPCYIEDSEFTGLDGSGYIYWSGANYYIGWVWSEDFGDTGYFTSDTVVEL